MSVFTTLKSSLKNAFDYAVYRESTENRLKKPQVIAALVTANMPFADGTESYELRLVEALKRTRTRDLETLQGANVSIILDTRLTAQTLGFADRAISGAYYQTAGKRIVALPDGGKTDAQGGMFDPLYSEQGAHVLERLAGLVREGALPKGDTAMYASRYAYHSGRAGTVTVMEWRAAAGFDQKTLAKNPALKLPPRP
ncbi:MAG: hypothetical protein PW788_04170 [Micavibrio sp.]|nr:hypothetical protein [Micavibrio sp.]